MLNYSAKTYRIRFKKVMNKLNLEHVPHECRHTLRTRLDNAGANQSCINFILGHKADNVEEIVYTHKTKIQLIETIDLLD